MFRSHLRLRLPVWLSNLFRRSKGRLHVSFMLGRVGICLMPGKSQTRDGGWLARCQPKRAECSRSPTDCASINACNFGDEKGSASMLLAQVGMLPTCRAASARQVPPHHLLSRLPFLSGYSAWTLSAIPPRAENCAVTIASRGAQTFTKSSRMRFVTASLKARSLR